MNTTKNNKNRDKNALTASTSSLACFEIRSRNKRAINSTRNKIYSLKVFHFLLYRRRFFYLFLSWFSMRVSDDQKYVWGRRLNACINTRKFKGLDYHCQRSKKWFTWHVISIIAENKPHAHQKNFLHTMTIAALLIKILIFFRPLSSVHLFQSNQRFEFVDRHVSEKL